MRILCGALGWLRPFPRCRRRRQGAVLLGFHHANQVLQVETSQLKMTSRCRAAAVEGAAEAPPSVAHAGSRGPAAWRT